MKKCWLKAVENISVIINSIVDDFLKSGKNRKLNLPQVFKNYTIDDILFYHKHGEYLHIKNDYEDLCSDDEYMKDAYKNFSTESKKNYKSLLKYIIDFVENQIQLNNSKKLDKIKYSKFVELSGNMFKSLPLTDINDSKILFTFNVKNNTLLIIFGNLDIDDNGVVTGIEQIFSKKLICPYFVIEGLTNQTITTREILENSTKIPVMRHKVTSSTFVVQTVY